MNCLFPILKRELKSYFATPVAYVFIVIFLFLSGLFTFQVGNFYDGGQANLNAFFMWLPWMYLFLIPAISMRLWAEERKTGTIELLLTLPTTLAEAVVAKFLAAWIFISIALFLTFPLVLTVMYLGEPDLGVMAAAYLGAFLMAGTYLSIGICMSALTKNQVVSFILSVVICFLFILAGYPIVLDFFTGWSEGVADAVASVSFLTHFNSIQRGLINLPDMIFFVSLMFGWLFAAAVILEVKKAQ